MRQNPAEFPIGAEERHHQLSRTFPRHLRRPDSYGYLGRDRLNLGNICDKAVALLRNRIDVLFVPALLAQCFAQA